MAALRGEQRDWHDLGLLDPEYMMLTDPAVDSRDLDSFFATGKVQVTRIMETAGQLGAAPVGRAAALDFGCGVGRLTRALAEHFDLVWGVDIAPSLIARASQLNSPFARCSFAVNATADLRMFSDAQFDLVYSELVLQHCPSTRTILSYVEEFLRVTKPSGLVVFQLPSSIPWRQRLQPRRRAYGVLRQLGVGREFLYRRLRLHPVRMNSVPQKTMKTALALMGATTVHIEANDERPESRAIRSRRYFVTPASTSSN
ncbi:MAG: class I SAM-dependent methyltransferase [Chloroflexota bacterium]|nr:class I SAM-dependent methyltransferase [Chloroflexota bacterium]